MATRKKAHYTTLSPESKMALKSGNFGKMMIQLKKLQLLYKERLAITAGPLHRHAIAMKRCIRQHMEHITQFTGVGSAKDTFSNANSTDPYTVDTNGEIMDCIKLPGERDTLSKRWMCQNKMKHLNTRKKVKIDDSLNEAIYKYYYQKLTKLTKMRVSPEKSSYSSRAKARAAGVPEDSDIQSYEEKFRILMHKVKNAWRPRDYIQRAGDYKSLFSRLCTSIMDSIRICTSHGGERLENMDRLDTLFKYLRRFKISSPTFRSKRRLKPTLDTGNLRGGGPKKCLKAKNVQHGQHRKENTIGEDALPVELVDSLSVILKRQFKAENGLQNVCNLYQASLMSEPLSAVLKQYNLKPVPNGSHAVQIHFCNDHYVTSQLRPSGVVVWDSVQTTEKFKLDLYRQLQLTYSILSGYSKPPKGLIKYTTDGLQDDFTSCGIFALLRAFFILSNVSYKINVNIGRMYLSSVLEKGAYSSYANYLTMHNIDNYIHNQSMLHAKKREKASEGSTNKIVHPGTKVTIRKRGRPALYSKEEREQRDRGSKLRHYHKEKSTKSSSNLPQCATSKASKSQTTARGRPATYSTEQRRERDRERRLRHYHKTKKTLQKPGRPTEYSAEEKRENLRACVKLLRQDDRYRNTERHRDRDQHREKR